MRARRRFSISGLFVRLVISWEEVTFWVEDTSPIDFEFTEFLCDDELVAIQNAIQTNSIRFTLLLSIKLKL